ncbi:MAG TPA: TetR/AcrR family transcriptional regulator [Gemmatimonadales bacterium]
MPRTTPSSRGDNAREMILEAACIALRSTPAATLTVDAIAKHAGCAKGLVHYHFKTKNRLLAEAAKAIWLKRAAEWGQALHAAPAEDGIQKGWNLLVAEATAGITKACASLAVLPDQQTGQAVSEGVADYTVKLASAVSDLFGAVGLAPSVPKGDLAKLALAVFTGLSELLVAGADPAELEGAYTAFWAAALSLSVPAHGA